MSYEGKTRDNDTERDEIPMGAGNELPVKAHFRRAENAWLYEKRGGQKTGRVLDMVSAFTKTVIHFAELNGPSHAELAYILAEQLAYIECNPKYTSETLAMARNANGKYNADPKSKARFTGAFMKLAGVMTDLQVEFGHAATYRAMALAIMSLQDMPAHLRKIGPDSLADDDFSDARRPLDFAGNEIDPVGLVTTRQTPTIFDDLNEIANRLGIKRNGGSFVDQANAKLDRANAGQSLGAAPIGEIDDDDSDAYVSDDDVADSSAVESIVAKMAPAAPTVEPTRRRWCSACRVYHNV